MQENPRPESTPPLGNHRGLNSSRENIQRERARPATPTMGRSGQRLPSPSREVLSNQHNNAQTNDLFAHVDPPKDRYSQTLELLNKGTSHAKEELIETVPARVKPRRDGDSNRTRTRIPMPVSSRVDTWDNPRPLKRFDSGVDINNMSPTEASLQEEEAWQADVLSQPEAYTMSNHNLHYNYVDEPNTQEYY